ncbi:MAG: citrate/2-methylcitrate synthase [Lachnospiraceae bacterium]
MINRTITPEIQSLSNLCKQSAHIKSELYTEYNVKRGLRDENGRGVLVGITEVSEVNATKLVNGKSVPAPGELFYRGYDIHDIITGIPPESNFGYEESLYLLLFGDLPNKEQLASFLHILAGYRELPATFLRDILMMAPSKDLMNMLARSVLTLYSYDSFADDITVPNVLRQCLQLTSVFPMLSVYGYQIYRHYHDGYSLVIHSPQKQLSTAETILSLLRMDGTYTQMEAKLLDICLVLHMEHGGGNNSTFTTRMVTSSGTDTYSAIAAALGSLKGNKHGGANNKVVLMMSDLKEHVKDWTDEDAISDYLRTLLNKTGFDHTGLIYGMGHAVYSLSDPRAEILRRFAKDVSREKNRDREYNLYALVSRLAPKVISEECKIFKGVSPNVDFFSGFVYELLDLPPQLYTPLFAISRISGWSAHRLEELLYNGKIMRPAYMAVTEQRSYLPIEDR